MTLIIITLLSCADDSALVKAMDAVISKGDGVGVLVELLKLDQEYPDRFILKYQIAVRHLAAGEVEAAEPYLRSAERLRGQTRDREKKAVVYGGLAITSYGKANYPDAVSYGEKSLALGAAASQAFGFITARGFLNMGRSKDALVRFDEAWQKARESMSAEDYRSYSRALGEQERFSDAIDVLAAYELALPYEQGLGLLQSTLYEKMHAIPDSVFAAAKEAEYARCLGALDAGLVTENIAALKLRLQDTDFNPDMDGLPELAVLEDYFLERWEHLPAAAAWQPAADTPFARFVALSGAIERDDTTSEEQRAFLDLLPYFKNLPSYFYRLSRLKLPSMLSAEDSIAALERAIDLAPRAPAAKDYRMALALRTGLSSSEGSLLLTREEIAAIAARAAYAREPVVLAPLLNMLGLRDSMHSMAAVGVLRAFSSDPGFKAYLIERRDSSTLRARERLDYIIDTPARVGL